MPKLRTRRRHSHEPHPLRGLFIACWVILGSALVLGAFWFLSKMGPRDVDYRELQVSTEISPEVRALQAESIALEAQFEEILAMRPAQPEDFALIRQAFEKQQAYVEATGRMDSDAVARARNLEERYQELASAKLWADSLAAETEAERLAQAKDYEAAQERYEEAFSKQREINERFTLSAGYDIGRATRLDRQIRFFQAEPLLQQSMAFEREAEALIEAKEWSLAEAKLQEAIKLQDQLNREFRGANQSSVARLEQLRIKRVGILSGRSHEEIRQIVDRADARQAEGKHLEAADLFLQAARLQDKLNEAYRESPYASSEQVAEFLRRAETAQSYDLGLVIENNHRILIDLLAARRPYEAAQVIVQLRRDMEQMQTSFPRSSLNDEQLRLKIRYLNLVQNDLGFIQDRVYDSLLPIPEESGWKILRTEVPQALYSQIMGTNPSRNPGDKKPVDSVSWVEAKDFCERLSWILGKPVRLPTENEFRQALGRLRYVVLEDHVWSVANSGGTAQPVGQREPFADGCYDLLGNVSEWLESIDRFENESAQHIGGHVQDRLETIFTVPVREAARGERNRLIGFRVVVQVD